MPIPHPGDDPPAELAPSVRRPADASSTCCARHLGARRAWSSSPAIPGSARRGSPRSSRPRPRRSGAAVHWGRCWEGDGAPAFWPWIQILRALARSADAPPTRSAMAAARARATLEGRLDDDASIRPRSIRRPRASGSSTRSRRCSCAVAGTRPLVLVLEDLHWADLPSLVLLQFLVRHARTAPLLVRRHVSRRRDRQGAPLARAARASSPATASRCRSAGSRASDVERYVAATLGDDARARSRRVSIARPRAIRSSWSRWCVCSRRATAARARRHPRRHPRADRAPPAATIGGLPRVLRGRRRDRPRLRAAAPAARRRASRATTCSRCSTRRSTAA